MCQAQLLLVASTFVTKGLFEELANIVYIWNHGISNQAMPRAPSQGTLCTTLSNWTAIAHLGAVHWKHTRKVSEFRTVPNGVYKEKK